VRTDQCLSSEVRTSEDWGGSDIGEAGDIPPTIPAFTRPGDDGSQPYENSFSGYERNKLFLNRAGTEFADISAISGLDSDKDGRSFVPWDYDRDGRLDVALVNANSPTLTLYRNRLGDIDGAHPGNSIAIRFVGANTTARPSPGSSPRDGYGAKVTVEFGERTVLREFRCGEGFASQNSSIMLVGIGDAEHASKVTVTWPSGATAFESTVNAGEQLVAFEDGRFERSPYVPLSHARAPSPAATELVLDIAGDRDDGEAGVRIYTSMATWCAACTRMLPRVARLREVFSADEVALFGVPVDDKDDTEMLAEYVRKKSPSYVLLDDLNLARRAKMRKTVQATTGSEALPSTIATDARGRVLKAWSGVPSVSDVRQLLEQFTN